MKQPSQFRRVIWVFVALPAYILLLRPSDLVSYWWWRGPASSELAGVTTAVLAGALLGVFCARDIWYLVTRHPSLWQVLLAQGITLAVLAAAIALRESGVWQWTFAERDAFMSSLCLTVAGAAAITEYRKNVRVYLTARHYMFIRGAPDA
jgi:hypothetical protein